MLLLFTLLVALFGMFAGWWGRRSARHAGAARWGLILNSITVGILLASTLGIAVWWQLR